LCADILKQLVSQLPKTVNPATIALSNAPNGGDSKKLIDIVNFKVGQIGLKCVCSGCGLVCRGLMLTKHQAW
jgi:hypothetical protein